MFIYLNVNNIYEDIELDFEKYDVACTSFTNNNYKYNRKKEELAFMFSKMPTPPKQTIKILESQPIEWYKTLIIAILKRQHLAIILDNFQDQSFNDFLTEFNFKIDTIHNEEDIKNTIKRLGKTKDNSQTILEYLSKVATSSNATY